MKGKQERTISQYGAQVRNWMAGSLELTKYGGAFIIGKLIEEYAIGAIGCENRCPAGPVGITCSNGGEHFLRLRPARKDIRIALGRRLAARRLQIPRELVGHAGDPGTFNASFPNSRRLVFSQPQRRFDSFVGNRGDFPEEFWRMQGIDTPAAILACKKSDAIYILKKGLDI